MESSPVPCFTITDSVTGQQYELQQLNPDAITILWVKKEDYEWPRVQESFLPVYQYIAKRLSGAVTALMVMPCGVTPEDIREFPAVNWARFVQWIEKVRAAETAEDGARLLNEVCIILNRADGTIYPACNGDSPLQADREKRLFDLAARMRLAPCAQDAAGLLQAELQRGYGLP